jgi:hypothetical protein
VRAEELEEGVSVTLAPEDVKWGCYWGSVWGHTWIYPLRCTFFKGIAAPGRSKEAVVCRRRADESEERGESVDEHSCQLKRV